MLDLQTPETCACGLALPFASTRPFSGTQELLHRCPAGNASFALLCAAVGSCDEPGVPLCSVVNSTFLRPTHGTYPNVTCNGMR